MPPATTIALGATALIFIACACGLMAWALLVLARIAVARYSGGAPSTSISTAAAEPDPPPLSIALAQLLWRVRDPGLVAALAHALRYLSEQPPLQPLGKALAAEAPDAFAVVARLLHDAPAKPLPFDEDLAARAVRMLAEPEPGETFGAFCARAPRSLFVLIYDGNVEEHAVWTREEFWELREPASEESGAAPPSKP